MLLPEYDDEVLLTLQAIDASPDVVFPDRDVFFNRSLDKQLVGRASKRDTALRFSSKINCLFDSQVVSRQHAQFEYDFKEQAVFIKDLGSSHGTFLNSEPLHSDRRYKLNHADIVQFGAAVARHLEVTPPCKYVVFLQYGTARRPENRPITFRVPDDSDCEEEFENADPQIRNTIEILQRHNIYPAEPVDLTRPVQPTQATDYEATQRSFVDLTSPITMSERGSQVPRFSPIDGTPQVTEITVEETVPLTELQEEGHAMQSHSPVLETLAHTSQKDNTRGEQDKPQPRVDMLGNDGLVDDSLNDDDDDDLDDDDLKMIDELCSSPSFRHDCKLTQHTSEPELPAELLQTASLPKTVPEDVPINKAKESTDPKQPPAVPTPVQIHSQVLPREKSISSKTQAIPTSSLVIKNSVPLKKAGNKRSANELSQMDDDNGIKSLEGTPQAASVQGTTTQSFVSEVSDVRCEPIYRPKKKLRKFVEAAAYATFGGAVVMSALIATAPDL